MTTMKAARIYDYGGPEVFRVEDVARPVPGPHDVLIEVHASSVNPVDTKIRAGGQRGIVRLKMPWILGLDVSGVVVAKGDKVTAYEVGDEVYSSPTHRRPGCYAEYVAVDQAAVAKKPAGLTHAEAASLPLVGLTAMRCLEDTLRAGQGQERPLRVHIQAGAGGVGTFAIQMAKMFGAEVSTTCSPRNEALVRSLGADTVIDYRAQPFDEVVHGADAILESVGGEDCERALRAVRKGGEVAIITTGLPERTKRYGGLGGALMTGLWMAGWVVRGRLRGIKARAVVRAPDGDGLRRLTEWVEAGHIKPVVEQSFGLDDIAAAHALLERGGFRGKIAVTTRAA